MRIIRNKKIIKTLLAFSIAFFLLSPVSCLLSFTNAASPTPVPSQNSLPEDSADLEKIQRIKDLVASKVAELNLVEKRGIIGTVREVSKMNIVVTDIKGFSRQIEVDELTKFNVAKGSSGISDLAKGKSYSFVGIYNKDTKKLLARTVNNVDTMPVFFEGTLTAIDEDSYQLKVVNEKGDQKSVDIENSTKTSLATEDGDLKKSGFSKLDTNQRILAVGFWDTKDSNLLTATRIIHFETVPPSKQMQSHVKIPETNKTEDN